MTTESRAACPRDDGTKTDAVTRDCAGSFEQYRRWLQSLKHGDAALVRNGAIHFPVMISDGTPRFLFTGKLKFHRLDGWQVGRQAKRVYRMKLRLVRNKEDLK